jgi:DNA-binding MarR family transcriptional regulator
MDSTDPPAPATAQYEQLARLRGGLRRYLAWAEERAREHDLTPAQYQLALAIQVSPDPLGPSVTELADTLLLRHHSVVGLVDRAEAIGLVRRGRDPARAAVVHVTLTEHGADVLARLTALHLDELAALAPEMRDLWGAFGRR